MRHPIVLLALLMFAACATDRQPGTTLPAPTGAGWLSRAQRQIAEREYRASRNERACRRRTAPTICAPISNPAASACSTARGRGPALLELSLVGVGPRRSSPIRAGEVSSGRARRGPPRAARRVVRELAGRTRAGLHAHRAAERRRPTGARARGGGRQRVARGDAVVLASASGRKLGYGKLVAFDASGHALAARIGS